MNEDNSSKEHSHSQVHPIRAGLANTNPKAFTSSQSLKNFPDSPSSSTVLQTHQPEARFKAFLEEHRKKKESSSTLQTPTPFQVTTRSMSNAELWDPTRTVLSSLSNLSLPGIPTKKDLVSEISEPYKRWIERPRPQMPPILSMPPPADSRNHISVSAEGPLVLGHAREEADAGRYYQPTLLNINKDITGATADMRHSTALQPDLSLEASSSKDIVALPTPEAGSRSAHVDITDSTRQDYAARTPKVNAVASSPLSDPPAQASVRDLWTVQQRTKHHKAGPVLSNTDKAVETQIPDALSKDTESVQNDSKSVSSRVKDDSTRYNNFYDVPTLNKERRSQIKSEASSSLKIVPPPATPVEDPWTVKQPTKQKKMAQYSAPPLLSDASEAIGAQNPYSFLKDTELTQIEDEPGSSAIEHDSTKFDIDYTVPTKRKGKKSKKRIEEPFDLDAEAAKGAKAWEEKERVDAEAAEALPGVLPALSISPPADSQSDINVGAQGPSMWGHVHQEAKGERYYPLTKSEINDHLMRAIEDMNNASALKDDPSLEASSSKDMVKISTPQS